MHEDLASRLSDRALLTAFGVASYHGGRAQVRDGVVTGLVIDPEKGVISAVVHGSQGAPYHAVLTRGRSRSGFEAPPTMTGVCTCPGRAGCKHVAAVALVARDLLTSAPAPARARAADIAPWERSVAGLVNSPEPLDINRGTPMALQVEVVRRSGGARPEAVGVVERIRLRPVVPGASGGWVRSGVTWQSLAYSYGADRRDRAHREALRALYAAHEIAERGRYSYGERPVYLGDLGPQVWRLLEDVVDAGVRLVPVKASGAPVLLAADGAVLTMDLSRREGGDVTLAPAVSLDGEPLVAQSVSFVGEPVHGLVLEGARPAEPALGVGRASGAGLVLAPFRERVAPHLSPAVRSGEQVRIPAGDVERFLRDYYPSLRQVVTLTSADGSVALPEVAPPALVLVVTYSPNHGVDLEWSVDYRVGDQVRRFALADRPQPSAAGPASPSPAARDLRAEARLAADLPLPADRLPLLRDPTAEHRLVSPVRLSGMDAVTFLEDVVPRLREVGVLVEEIGQGPDYRLSEAAPLIRVSATDSGDRDWFDLGVHVSVDGEDVPFVRLFVALAQGETHLLLESGTYFAIRRPEYEDLRRLIEEARNLEDREGPPRISRYQVSLWEDLSALGVVESQSDRWARTVAGLSTVGEELPRPPVPVGLDADLRPYQVEGYQWLAFLWEHELGGVLADDMGLGKTLQALAAVARAKELGAATAPVLVVAPTSVVPNWASEAARFVPGLRVATVSETRARRGSELAGHVTGADLVITSYALFRIEYAAYDALPWSALVLDEAQFVKNHQARTYQCARRLAAPVKVAITGTPLENSLMDLWSMLSIVAPGLFPSPTRFAEVFRTPIERQGDVEQLATLRRRIRPLMRRRTKEQVAAELPPKLEHVLKVELGPRHRKIYDTHLQRERQKVLGMLDRMGKNRFEIFRSLTHLRQLSLDPALIDAAHDGVGSAKVDVLLEQLRDVVDGGHRALVFSQFTGFLRRVRDRLDAEGVPYVYLDGRTRNRGQRIDEFRSGRAPVFLISLKAGGFGLNLTEADYCFVLDPWWNPAVEAQAVDRTHRIGQDKTVMVYRLVSAGTIEEKVMALKAKKQDLFARVMDDGALMSGPISADDIRGLLG